MLERIATMIVGLILFIPIIWVGSWILEVVIFALALMGLYELHKMRKISAFSFPSIISSIGVAIIVFSNRLPYIVTNFNEEYYLIIIVVLLLLISTLIDRNYTFDDAGISTLGVIYIGFGFYSFIEVREASLHLLLLILVVIWSTDIGAYLVGRQIGKRKLAPVLSPNKTIEGAIGGTVIATILASIYLLFISFQYSYMIMLGMMILLSVAGQIGDLIESGMKRHFGVKDSGTILPGHGGILDRFDSMLFVLSLAVLLGLT